MADLGRTVKILFEAEDKLSKNVKLMEQRLDAFGRSASDIAAPLAAGADKVLELTTAVHALAGLAIGFAIQKNGEFSESFGEITTLVSTAGADMEAFRESILDYARDSGKSLEDLNGAIYTAISAGQDYTDALALVEQAEQAAVAGKADLQSTTLLLASTMNAYGKEVGEVGAVSDVFFQIVKYGLTTLPELAEHFGQVTNIAANAGVPIETLGAAIASLTASGVNTPEAITAIKSAISNIIKPSKEASELAAQLGIGFDAQTLKAEGLEVILKNVATATGGNAEQMAVLFGNVRGLNAAMTLTGTGSEKFNTALGAMKNSAGATSAAYAKMADEMGIINQKLVNNFDIMLVKIGEKLEGSYKGIAGGVTDIFKGIQESTDNGAFDEIFDLINGFGNRAAELLEEIGENLPEALADVEFSGLVKSLKSLGSEMGDVFKSIFGDLDLSKAEDLSKFIKKVVDGIEGLHNMAIGVLEGMKPLFEALGVAIEHFEDLDDTSQEAIGNVMGAAKSVKFLADHIKILSGAFILIGGTATLNSITTLGKFGTAAATSKIAVSGLTSAVGILASPVGLVGLAGTVGYLGGLILTELCPPLETAGLGFWRWVDSIIDFTGRKGDVDISPELKKSSEATAETTEEIKRLDREIAETDRELAILTKMQMEKSPDEFVREIGPLTLEAQTNLDELKAKLKESGALVVPMEADSSKAKKEIDEVVIGYREKTKEPITIKFDARTADAEKKVDKLKDKTKEIPESKRLEIQLQGEIDKELAIIKNQAETVQTAMEWKAKLDIAEAEAAAKIMEAAFSSIDTGITSTGELLGGLFEQMSGADSQMDKWKIEDQIDKENELRKKTFELQEKLTESQIEYNNAKTERMKDGESMVTVQAEGITPALEMVFHEILKMCQLSANAEGLDLLLGA